MPSVLDERMAATTAHLTAPGGPLALGEAQRHGITLPTIATAPPTLPAYFAHFCGVHADTIFLVDGDERLTFAQVHTAARAIAAGLASGAGDVPPIAPGDRVGIAMRNSPAWIALYMGILMAGGVATLLNGWWQGEELEAAIQEVGCTLVFADAPRAERLAGVPVRVVAIDDAQALGQAVAGVSGDPATPLPTVEPLDHATILFTSGSTGQSKGALSDHRGVVQATFNYLAQALTMLGIATADGNPPTTQPCTLLNLPLFHVTAMVPMMLQSFAMGRKLVLMRRWDAEAAMKLIEAEAITYFVGVPLMSFEILTHPRRGDYDLSTVADFAAGGASRPVDHVRRLDAEMGGAPLIGYGLTETNGVGTGNWRSNYVAKPASAGPASRPLVELAIMDDAGREMAQGERGEVCIRTVCNFLGYWNRPDATAAAMTADGYFRTGDVGYLDEDGYLFIVDRKKDIIIRGGENISCQEVEAALYRHPGVAEAAVFGLFDERLGEVPGAVVHLSDDTLSPETLRDWLHAHVAAFKVPTRIWVEEAPLPRLGTEKIDKVSLRARFRAAAATADAA